MLVFILRLSARLPRVLTRIDFLHTLPQVLLAKTLVRPLVPLQSTLLIGRLCAYLDPWQRDLLPLVFKMVLLVVW